MIGLYRGKSWLSRAVRWRTWSDYSHASWICGNGSVYESWMPGGVRHTKNVNEGHTPGTEIDIFNIDIPTRQLNRILAWFESQVGKPYDLWAILGFISRRKLEDPSAWVCSEYLYQGLHLNGVYLFAPSTPADRVHPGLLSYSPLLTKDITIVTR